MKTHASVTGLSRLAFALVLLLTVFVALSPVTAVLACHYITFSGYKYEDLNGNGLTDAGEPGLAGWLITIEGFTDSNLTLYKMDCDDADSDSVTDDKCYFTVTTQANGSYNLAVYLNSSVGYWRITETSPSGETSWVYSNPANGQHVAHITVSGQSTLTKDFLNLKPGQLIVDKDWYVNGIEVEPPATPAEICVKRTGPGTPVPSPLPPVYEADGTTVVLLDATWGYCQTFSDEAIWKNLWPGDYAITEKTTPAGWIPFPTTSKTVNSGETVYKNKVNDAVLGSIQGAKFWDNDGNGAKDDIEAWVGGWTIELFRRSADGSYPADPTATTTTADSTGAYSFTSLEAGTYKVCEGAAPAGDWTTEGYVQTLPAGGACHEVTIPDGGWYDFTGKDFGNRMYGSLEVKKIVDWGGVPHLPRTFSICVSGPSWPVPADHPYDPASCQEFAEGETKSWDNLIPGEYTIHEWHPGVGWDTTGLGAITVNSGTPAAYREVTNTLTATGELEVTKAIYWNGVTPDGQVFEICIQGPSYAEPDCQTTTENATLRWTGLIPGEYTITETDPGVAWVVTGNNAVVTVPDGGTATAEVTNTLTPNLGNLEVLKTVQWNRRPADGAAEFTICVRGESFPSPTLDNGGCQTAPYNGGLLTWTGLIPGDYAISELDPGTIWAVEVVTPSVNVPAGGLAHGDVINITDQESPPTAVDLVRWTTLGGSGSVAHSWATAGENGTQAFRLYRSAAANRGTATLVTEVGATGTANAGSSYAYLDAGLAAGTYYYWLVEVSGDGSEAQIAGPREVVVGSAIQRVTTRVFIPISIGG